MKFLKILKFTLLTMKCANFVQGLILPQLTHKGVLVVLTVIVVGNELSNLSSNS